MSKEGTSPIVFCPHAEVYVGMERFYHSGRRCKVDSLICLNWDNPEVYAKCPVRKEGRR